MPLGPLSHPPQVCSKQWEIPSKVLHVPKFLAIRSFLSSDSFRSMGDSRSLQDAIDRFAKNASKWNKTHFGNIFGKKKRVMSRLVGVQKALARNPSHSLLELEENLHIEMN